MAIDVRLWAAQCPTSAAGLDTAIVDPTVAEFAYAVSDANLLPGQISPDPDVEDHYSGLEEEARYALLETIPSSLPGAIALLDYVEGLGTGRSNPRGLSDNAFDDNLLDVISSALECLRDHVLGAEDQRPT